MRFTRKFFTRDDGSDESSWSELMCVSAVAVANR